MQMDNIKLNKKQIITTFFILFCLMGYVFFQANGFFQYKAVFVIFLIVLPFFYNKLFLAEDNFFRKIKITNLKNDLKILSLGLIITFLIIVLFFKYTDIQRHYLLSPIVKKDFWQFLLYEFTSVAFTVAVYEIFFRGFVMFYFSPFLN